MGFEKPNPVLCLLNLSDYLARTFDLTMKSKRKNFIKVIIERRERERKKNC